MDHYNIPAITIGGNDGYALGVARNLGPRGIDVYCASSHRFEITRYSKYCRKFFLIPGIEHDAVVLQRFLRSYAAQWPERAVLFPTSDTAVLALASIQKNLDGGLVSVIPDYEIVEIMAKKAKFYPSLQRWQVPHPRTLFPHHNDVTRTVSDLIFPVYLRPSESMPFVTTFGCKGFVARNPNALHTYLHLTERYGFRMMVQEIIPGPIDHEYIFRGYFNRDSRPVIIYTARKVRKPGMFSNNTINVSIEVTPNSPLAAFQQLFVAYFKKIQYKGLFGAEFKWDPRDGQFKLLEVNARSMSGTSIGPACGANDVLAAYHDAVGNDLPDMTAYTPGIHLIGILGDLRVLVKRMLHGQMARHDLVPYLLPKTWYVFKSEDPAPFLMYLLTYIHWERHKARVKRTARQMIKAA